MNLFKTLLIFTTLLLEISEVKGMDDDKTSSVSVSPRYDRGSLQNLYYSDDDITDYLECFLRQNTTFFHPPNFQYLLTSNTNNVSTIRDKEENKDYFVVLGQAINEAGVDYQKTYRGGYLSSASIEYFFDAKARPKDHQEETLGDLVKFLSEQPPPSYEQFLQKIDALKIDSSKLEFVYEIIKSENKNIINIQKKIQNELKRINFEKNDIFNELQACFFNTASSSRAKILFPYNIDDVHWLAGEILIHKDKNKYKIEVYSHDPYGDGVMLEKTFIDLKNIIQKRIQELDRSAKGFSFKNRKSPYHARQLRNDGISCGVIAAEDILKRIEGKTLSVDKPHEYGALQLRKIHVNFFIKEKDDTHTNLIYKNLQKIKKIEEIETLQKDKKSPQPFFTLDIPPSSDPNTNVKRDESSDPDADIKKAEAYWLHCYKKCMVNRAGCTILFLPYIRGCTWISAFAASAISTAAALTSDETVKNNLTWVTLGLTLSATFFKSFEMFVNDELLAENKELKIISERKIEENKELKIESEIKSEENIKLGIVYEKQKSLLKLKQKSAKGSTKELDTLANTVSDQKVKLDLEKISGIIKKDLKEVKEGSKEIEREKQTLSGKPTKVQIKLYQNKIEFLKVQLKLQSKPNRLADIAEILQPYSEYKIGESEISKFLSGKTTGNLNSHIISAIQKYESKKEEIKPQSV